MASKVRLYVDHPLGAGQSVPLGRDQANYLFNVMRLSVGSVISVFNGRDGEWDAEVTKAGKRAGDLACVAQTAPLRPPPDLWLIFAPIKKARTDFIVEKAVEMGTSRIVPVITEYTNSERVRVDRLQAHAIEAAEQCGATFVPEVAEPVKFDALLRDWEMGRAILHCDEAAAGDPAASGLEQGVPTSGRTLDPWAILIGPEGGFSQAEREKLHQKLEGRVVVQSLGPRILRADTAAVAALTLWQTALGDWR